MIRLDKFISVNTSFSRNEIRIAARRGRISVNGENERAFDRKINPDTDIVKINDITVSETGMVYLVINKPAGVISASDDKNKTTVVDLVSDKFGHLDLFPVGRLDKDTTGLLIITNDGDFAHRVISPKNDVPKCYEVTLDGEPESRLISEFKKGVVLADGTCCKPAELEITGPNTVLITITEGKYHQVKRMFGVYGLGVDRLHRKSIGDLTLPQNLGEGEYMQIEGDTIMNKVLKSL